MKLTDIQVGADYAVGGRNTLRRGVVIEKGNLARVSYGGRTAMGPAVRVRYEDGTEQVIIPPLVNHPWSTQQAIQNAIEASRVAAAELAEATYNALSEFAASVGLAVGIEARVDDVGDLVIQLPPPLAQRVLELLQAGTAPEGEEEDEGDDGGPAPPEDEPPKRRTRRAT